MKKIPSVRPRPFPVLIFLQPIKPRSSIRVHPPCLLLFFWQCDTKKSTVSLMLSTVSYQFMAAHSSPPPLPHFEPTWLGTRILQLAAGFVWVVEVKYLNRSGLPHPEPWSVQVSYLYDPYQNLPLAEGSSVFFFSDFSDRYCHQESNQNGQAHQRIQKFDTRRSDRPPERSMFWGLFHTRPRNQSFFFDSSPAFSLLFVHSSAHCWHFFQINFFIHLFVCVFFVCFFVFLWLIDGTLFCFSDDDPARRLTLQHRKGLLARPE